MRFTAPLGDDATAKQFALGFEEAVADWEPLEITLTEVLWEDFCNFQQKSTLEHVGATLAWCIFNRKLRK